MNWLLVGVIFTLIFCTIKGYTKGFIRVAFSLVSFFLVIAFVIWATPYISGYLEKNTEVYGVIQQKCEERLQISGGNVIQEQAQTETDNLELAGIVLPKALQEQLLGEGVEAANNLLESSGLYAEVAGTLAHFIVSGISFFLALIVALLLKHIIFGILNLVSHLPIIHGINKVLGIAAGFVQGLFYVWLFFYLVAVCCASSFGMLMNQFIAQSSFLTYLYNNNLLLQILIQFF